MWCFTEHGFFTFVTDRKDPSYLWLRARMREHLEDNFPGIVVTEHPGADYLFRAKVKRADVAQRIAEMVMDSRIDSHFKDVMIKTAAKPKTGSLSNVMYAIWRGAAEWQPYAPYSKIPRGQERKYWTPPARQGGGTTVTTGSYAYGRDYDWDGHWARRGTPIGETAKDPAIQSRLEEPDGMSAEEFDQAWATMTPEEQLAYLDREEEQLRELEESGQLDALFRQPGELPGPRDWEAFERDRRSADRDRQTKIRGRKGKRGRKNRHNQQG